MRAPTAAVTSRHSPQTESVAPAPPRTIKYVLTRAGGGSSRRTHVPVRAAHTGPPAALLLGGRYQRPSAADVLSREKAQYSQATDDPCSRCWVILAIVLSLTAPGVITGIIRAVVWAAEELVARLAPVSLPCTDAHRSRSHFRFAGARSSRQRWPTPGGNHGNGNAARGKPRTRRGQRIPIGGSPRGGARRDPGGGSHRLVWGAARHRRRLAPDPASPDHGHHRALGKWQIHVPALFDPAP